MSQYIAELKNDPEFRHLIVWAVKEALSIIEQAKGEEPEDGFPNMMSCRKAVQFGITRRMIENAIRTGDLKQVNFQGFMKFRKIDLINYMKFGSANIHSEQEFQLSISLKKYRK